MSSVQKHLLTSNSQLLENISVITTLSYPKWIQYPNISQFALRSASTTNLENFYIVTRIHAEVLQTKFLLERLKQTPSSRDNSQNMFNAAQELMAVTLSLWIDRDRLHKYQNTLHWMVLYTQSFISCTLANIWHRRSTTAYQPLAFFVLSSSTPLETHTQQIRSACHELIQSKPCSRSFLF